MEITRDEATGKPIKIRMRKPADMHQHLRQHSILELVAPMVAKRFQMAIIMPNTTPPITTGEAVIQYRQEILKAAGGPFLPLMTMYLTDELNPIHVSMALERRHIWGVKYYPRGLTTNSDSGVKTPASLWTEDSRPYEVLRALAEEGGVLLLHAADGLDKEGNELDPWDQEKHFIRETLPRIIDAHPKLKISVEHLSTKEGARFLENNGGTLLGCSLTAHHLLLDRRDMMRAGFRPHRFWWPVIQRKEDKEALLALATKGYHFVWLGSDSAPHPREKKEADCCSGGVLMAHAGIELYAEAFEGMLEKLENFACFNGPRFYGAPTSKEEITLVREDWTVRSLFRVEQGGYDKPIVPFRLGETIRWKLVA